MTATPRTRTAILAEIMATLPANLRSLSPVLAGTATALELTEQAASDLASNLEIGTAEGQWLDLIAKGQGLRRQVGETDTSLRQRLRTTPDALTRPAILAAVDAILAEYSAGHSYMIEWFDGPYLDDAYLDDPESLYGGGPNTFILIVPAVAGVPVSGSYLDESYLDDSYLGNAGYSPLYQSISAAVERIRAAGVRWWIALDTTGALTA